MSKRGVKLVNYIISDSFTGMELRKNCTETFKWILDKLGTT